MKLSSLSVKHLGNVIFDRAVISWVAMTVSITSLYVTVIEPANIKIQPGQSFQFWHDNRQQLQIDYPLNFSNSGARTGPIISLALVIESDKLEQAILCKWAGTKKYNNGWQFTSRERPISVMPNATVDEMINFNCGTPGVDWIPEPGTYNFNFLAWIGDAENISSKSSVDVEIDEHSQKQIRSRLLGGRSNGYWHQGSGFSGKSRFLSTDDLKKLLNTKQ